MSFNPKVVGLRFSIGDEDSMNMVTFLSMDGYPDALSRYGAKLNIVFHILLIVH